MSTDLGSLVLLLVFMIYSVVLGSSEVLISCYHIFILSVLMVLVYLSYYKMKFFFVGGNS